MKLSFDALRRVTPAPHVERAQHPRALVTFTFAPSRVLRRVQWSLVVGAALLLAVAGLPWWAVALGWAALVGYVKPRKPYQGFEALQLLPDDAIALRCETQPGFQPAAIIGLMFVSPWCVALRLHCAGSAVLLIFPDQLPAAQFRLLRLRLKHLREQDGS